MTWPPPNASPTDLAVMYASRLIESGPIDEVLPRSVAPVHRRTPGRPARRRRFVPLPGDPPDLTALDDGCAFAARSARHREVCNGDPALGGTGERRAACGLHRVPEPARER